MPVISAKLIRSSRAAQRYCETCAKIISPGWPCLRLYGNAELNDPPWVLFLHPECAADLIADGAWREDTAKVNAALMQYTNPDIAKETT